MVLKQIHLVINGLWSVKEKFEGQVCMLRGLHLNPTDRDGQKDEQKPSVTVSSGQGMLQLKTLA